MENLVLTKGPLDKTKELIPDFVTLLGQHDPDFKEVKSEHLKTTFKLIETIYNELKNNARKIEKEIQAGRILPYSPPEVHEIPQPKSEKEPSLHAPPKSADGAVVAKEESVKLVPSSRTSSEIEPESSSSGTKLKSKSKRIKKDSVVKYLENHARKYPKEWKEIELLREVVKCKYWDLKYAEHQLAKKVSEF